MSTATTSRYIVTKGGVICSLVDLGLGTRKRVLMPGGVVSVFPSRRVARRRIARTKELCGMLAGSMLADWPKLEPLLADTAWEILPATLS
jgi:hypothetical protein